MEPTLEPPPKRFSGLGAVVIFVGIAVMISLFWTQIKQAQQRGRPALQTLGQTSTWEATPLTGTSSSTLRSNDLADSLLVVHFLRSVDSVEAWMMRDRLTQLLPVLDQVRDSHVRIVTFYDGEETDPVRLQDFFAGLRQAGVGDTPRHLLALPQVPEGQSLETFRHAFFFPTGGQNEGDHLADSVTETRFVVVDAQGAIRAYRDGRNPEAAGSLLQDIGALVRELKSVPPAATSEALAPATAPE